MSNAKKVVIKPIGFIKTKAIGKEIKKKSNISEIVLHKDLKEALDGLQDFSHLFVIFWMDKILITERKVLQAHPRGRTDMPLLGVFATRIAKRPNPIGLTLVQLLKIENNVLTVRGLDAFDGTPVIDIKPFDYWDISEEAKVPEWWMKLEKERTNQ